MLDSIRFTTRRTALTAGMLATACAAAAANEPVTADFDGNGFQDIVIGNPRENMYDTRNSGLLGIIYTDAAGLHSGINATWQRRGAAGFGQDPGDRYGHAVAVGDFNGDGFDDAVTGAPGAWRYSYHPLHGSRGIGIGTVHQSLGGDNGLGHTGGRTIRALRDEFERFGHAFAVADFDQDGFDDVAVGAPGSYPGESNGRHGSVTVYYGSATGLKTYGVELIHRHNRRINRSFQIGDQFGHALAAGDLDCNGHPDLAIAAPTATSYRGERKAGSVTLVFFGRYGILRTQTIRDGAEASNAGDEFGTALAIGHFEAGDSCADLVIGAKEKVGSKTRAGAVTVLYNRPGRIGYRREVWHQSLAAVPGKAEKYDGFGSSLAVADFDQNGIDDLAVGSPGETFESYWPDRKAAGRLTILYGDYDGLYIDDRASDWYQGHAGLEGKVEQFDAFATTLSTGDFNADGYADLMIGTPYERVGSSNDTHGALQFLYGSRNGLRASRTELTTLHADIMTWGGGWLASIPLSFMGLALP